ncbi:MAG: hypothetical protein ACREID_08520 [Planctomycetota bacterium]
MKPALAALLLAAACGGSGPTVAPVPEFQLEDVNPNSPSYTALVSPRAYLSFCSTWYFGTAT